MSTREQYEHDAVEFHRLSVELARLRFNFLSRSSFGQTRGLNITRSIDNAARACAETEQQIRNLIARADCHDG